MAQAVAITDIIQNSGVHKDWSPILRRCDEFEWTAVRFSGTNKGYRVSSPDGAVTFRIPNGRSGNSKLVERQVTRWLAEQHLKAEGIDADPGEVTEVYPLGGDGNGKSQIRCETHDVTFTSVDVYTAHVAKTHAKMDPNPTEPESVAPEPVQTPSEAPAEEESTESEQPAKNTRGKDYQRGPYRKSVKMDGWLARELWKQMRAIVQGKDEALSSYCQRLADRIDPNRHDAPGWGVETRPKEVVREVEKEVVSPQAQEALELVEKMRGLLGADPALKAALEEQIEHEQVRAHAAEAEAKRLRENLAAIVGLSKDVLEGDS